MGSKNKNKVVAVAAEARANVLTFQKYPLLQIRDEDPSCDGDFLEILLRPDSVRIATICRYENEGDVGRTFSLYVSQADFEAFVECGHAHHFEASTPENKSPAWEFRENPLLQIVSESLDRNNYLEILLRPDGASFALTASDHEGISRENLVRISPTSFKALVERCRAHCFEVNGDKG